MKNVFYSRLGKKIKSRRKELRLTQSEVCGSFITRNMLSRIESGDAHPSLDTLIYLAGRLDLPAAYLMCTDEKSESQFERMGSLMEIRRLFGSGQYKRCAALCRNIEADDDEISLICSECELMLAKEHLNNSRIASAERHLTAAAELAEKSIYLSERITDTIDFFRLLIECVRNGQMPDFGSVKKNCILLVDCELTLYIFAVSSFSDNSETAAAALPFLQTASYKNYIKAKLLMQDGIYDDAIPLLKTVTDSAPGFFTQYFAMQDLEFCCQKTDDYKSAYEYAKQRMQLADKYNK